MDGTELHLVAQVGPERGDRRLGGHPRAVEPPVDGSLDPPTKRLEERATTSVDAATARVLLSVTGEHRLQAEDDAANTATSRPVTSAQPIVRLMIRSISYRR